MQGIKRALEEWRALMGLEHVVVAIDPAYAAATFPTEPQMLAVLRPADASEVQAAVQIAATHHVPIYPISRGKNWGYGSRVPAAGACAVLSLERLDRIIDFDRDLAYITVEPGVTFGQVEAFLRAQGADLLVGSPGSTPEASLVGNAIERGLAAGLAAERCASVCGLEAVLADGRRLQTGFGRFAGAQAAPVSPYGIGPDLAGLFFQSGLGVVTRMTFWLTPRPAFWQRFSFSLTHEEDLDALIPALQAAMGGGLLQGSIGLSNAFKALSYLRQHPDPPRLITLAELPAEYQALLGGGVWFGEGTLTAPDADLGILMRRRLRLQLGDAVAQLRFDDEGAPDKAATSLTSVYWRKPAPPPPEPDPDRDGCGLIWCCPVVPFRAANIRQCLEIVEATLPAHGFEPIVGIQCATMRAAYVVASIVYDRAEPGHDAAALACYRQLHERLAGAGLYAYRLPILAEPPASHDNYDQVLRDLKATFDPAGILAPGRYAPPV